MIKIFPIVSSLAVAAGVFVCPVYAEPAEQAENSFTYSVSVPGEKVKSYSSASDGTLLVTNMKTGISQIKFKVKKGVLNGSSVSRNRISLSLDYVESSGHAVSLKGNGNTLVIKSTLLKSIAGSQTSPRLTARLNSSDGSGTSQIIGEMPVKDKKYKKAPQTFVNVNFGRYGTAKKGIELARDGTLKLNGKKLKTFRWWISEYQYSLGRWRASVFIFADSSASEAGAISYRMKINRSDGIITGMTYLASQIRTGDSEETWIADSSADAPSGWTAGKKFSYAYPLSAPKLKYVRSSKKKTIDLAWTKNDDASEYVIQFARNPKFSRSRTQSFSSDKKKARIYGLYSGYRYYVRIRAGRTVDGKLYSSKYSSVMTVEVK